MPTLADVRPGDVILLRKSHSFFGRLIRLWTHSPYSHAMIAVKLRAGTTERLCALESLEPEGVRLYPLDRYVRENTLDLFALRPGLGNVGVTDFALAHLGERYASSWQFVRSFGLLHRLWQRLTGRHLPDADARREFCSELAAKWLETRGCVLAKRPWETSPADLATWTEHLEPKGELTP